MAFDTLRQIGPGFPASGVTAPVLRHCSPARFLRFGAVLELLLAPTARSIPAWGEAPGKGKEENERAESPSYDLA
jgi:hypothetical protein